MTLQRGFWAKTFRGPAGSSLSATAITLRPRDAGSTPAGLHQHGVKPLRIPVPDASLQTQLRREVKRAQTLYASGEVG